MALMHDFNIQKWIIGHSHFGRYVFGVLTP